MWKIAWCPYVVFTNGFLVPKDHTIQRAHCSHLAKYPVSRHQIILCTWWTFSPSFSSLRDNDYSHDAFHASVAPGPHYSKASHPLGNPHTLLG